MQIGLTRTVRYGKVVWIVGVRPKRASSMIVLPDTFKTPFGALWAARRYWRSDD